MTPRRIIAQAVTKLLDIIAITDHNSAEHCELAMQFGKERGITVLPAMEITSCEEVHLLALFGYIKGIQRMQEIVYDHLPDQAPERISGYEQLIVNEDDEILKVNTKLLVSATALPLSYLINTIHSLGGLAIACHIDRESFSVLSQLGFISEDLEFDALEISQMTLREQAETRFRRYASFPWITSSDAHQLENIGSRSTQFMLKEPSFEEIKKALQNKRGITWV